MAEAGDQGGLVEEGGEGGELGRRFDAVQQELAGGVPQLPHARVESLRGATGHPFGIARRDLSAREPVIRPRDARGGGEVKGKQWRRRRRWAFEVEIGFWKSLKWKRR